ncbi:nickel-dependent hydrogenase large subunit [Sphaerotilus mobilis]|uniref:Hydrogenase large subunit n=1 Tax=Sphaerotilus mobilis TaxID=47994 RepID=A0A4Q7LU80_9BURK|nr:nickel-dependent hydrogenase large subunit [Sphaerotilus mobilis]RZS57893.1 hydrogenase large subunit [Sphaerotilus mobilis]
MSRTLVVGPFNRVEGDLEVRLDIVDGRVQSARVNAPMYRGFEQMLVGRDPMDALFIVPRICGICSVSQSVAAARALADLAGVEVPPNGLIATNLMLACENLADHLTHFHLFFMPDFARPVYASQPWFAEVERRFAAGRGEHARAATAARQRWFTLMGTLGGKWPHTQSIHPGGSSRAIDASERLRLLAKVRELQAFCEQTLFGAPLEHIAHLADEDALSAWADGPGAASDLALFLRCADTLDLGRAGIGPGRTLSVGAYRQADGSHGLAAGVWTADTAVQPLDAARYSAELTEDATHAWLATRPGDEPHADPARSPRHGHTQPQPDKPGAYTWNKAPRLAGRVVETGAVARQLASGQRLIEEAVRRDGTSVRTRVLARLIEIARVLPEMVGWLAALRPGEPYSAPFRLPEDGVGVGLTEAARGALGHWAEVRDGRIARWQIVAPTSINFSPRDAEGTPGALEAALVGARVEPGETTPVSVQHIVRSFDPCMVCTVH